MGESVVIIEWDYLYCVGICFGDGVFDYVLFFLVKFVLYDVYDGYYCGFVIIVYFV